ncbi:flagellar export protein FliJ [Helicobacter himalayensis]|uniref:flagellar export protein FliJ n=1 Tax=Helicobacter himalayensis TaxID=1591088 RepID=UPI003D6E3FDF
MDTKFSPILLVRKKALDTQERKILEHNRFIASKQEEIHHFLTQIAEIELPQGGNYLAYKAVLEVKNMLLAHLEQLHSELSSLKAQRKALEEEYKILNIEYEKMKYLDSKEKEMRLKQLRIAQQRQSDEVALILHHHKRLV